MWKQLPTHGGSLRVYGCHADDARATTAAVAALLAEEVSRGLRQVAIYREFQSRADRVKNELLVFLIEQKRTGKSIAAYGAAAKGTYAAQLRRRQTRSAALRVRRRAVEAGKISAGRTYSDPPPRRAARTAARRRADPSLEHRGRGRGAAWLRARLGRAIRRGRAGAAGHRMKVLVTGATGFVGRHVVPHLLARGHSVVAVARDEAKARSFPWFDGVRFVASTSMSHRDDPFARFGRPDAVMHLAWPGTAELHVAVSFRGEPAGRLSLPQVAGRCRRRLICW